MDPVGASLTADGVEHLHGGGHDAEPLVELVDDHHQHGQWFHVVAAGPHAPADLVVFAGVVGAGGVADGFTAGDLTPHRLEEALHERLVFLQVGDDAGDVRNPGERFDRRSTFEVGENELQLVG